MTRELNVRITLQDNAGYSDSQFRTMILMALWRSEHIRNVMVEVQTVEPETEKK